MDAASLVVLRERCLRRGNHIECFHGWTVLGQLAVGKIRRSAGAAREEAPRSHPPRMASLRPRSDAAHARRVAARAADAARPIRPPEETVMMLYVVRHAIAEDAPDATARDAAVDADALGREPRGDELLEGDALRAEALEGDLLEDDVLDAERLSVR